MPPKFNTIVIFVFLSVITISGVSVMGLLQTAERVGTSGVVIRSSEQTPPLLGPITSLPPEPKIEIDVFIDEACINPLSSFEWGEIEPGKESTKTIYLRNSGDVDVKLNLIGENWTPDESKDYMSLSWDYDGSEILSGEIREINVELSVSSDCPALDNFGFDLIIIGS
jgi:hypothetical protein